jgi:hypothetical protein
MGFHEALNFTFFAAMYIDDLTYSVAVPEPGGFVLGAVLIATLCVSALPRRFCRKPR